MFEIVTDNTADLFEGYYEQNPTRRLPFSFTLEDRFYEKDDEYPIELFYEKLKAGKLVKTSQINPHDAEVMFEQVLSEGKDVLYIGFSSGMSGSFDNISYIAKGLRIKYPDRKIVVIDTLAGAGGEGLLVYYAKKMQQEGKSMEEIAKWLEDNKLNAHHCFIVSDLINLQTEMNNLRPSVMMISIDNFEELLSDEKESEKSHILIQIEKLLETYLEEKHGILRKLAPDRFFAVAEDRYINAMIADKFKILEEVRAIPVTGKTPITLSIGVGIGSVDLEESEQFARQALEMAQGRGGDQAAVKRDDGYEFFGGVSKGIEKHTKVKTRIVAAALTDIIESSSSVYIMGHRNGDMDSVGSGAGLCGAIRILRPDIPVNMVVDLERNLAKPIIGRLNENLRDEEPVFISPEDALGKMDANSLLIIVDTNNKDLLDSPEVYAAAKQIVVIDHHRQVVNYIDNAVIFHHEPYASSACEMTAELIQYFPGIDKLQSYYADVMLAGIMLDTKDFVMRTGVRTFEAAAFLRKLGADMVAVKNLFANTMACIQKRSKLIADAEIYKRCAIAVDDTADEYIRVASAQAADQMLEIVGVDASFVIFRIPTGVNISARSLGAMNVQIIMEKLGGGGHQTMAAAQLNDVRVTEAKAELISAIDEYIQNIS